MRSLWMGRAWARAAALGCVAALLIGALGAAGGPVALAAMKEDQGRDGREGSTAGGRLPLVYVGPEGSGGGLLDRLRAQGYQDGRDLIVLSGGERDYVLEAAEVAEAIREAADGGGRRVNVIAVGPASLAARLAMLAGDGPTPVRTLVMIAPPNRGSFAATALRLAAQLERQVAFRVALGRLPAGERPDDPEPADEAAYVAARALAVYEPLVARYFREDKLASDGGRYPDFLTWLANKEKGLFDRAVVGAQAPPAMDRYPALAGLRQSPPGIDESLTAAFLEVEAARAAEYNYARLYQDRPPIDFAELDLLEALPKTKTGGLKRFILDVLSKLARALGGRILSTRRMQAEASVVSEALDFDAWTAPAARLTTEDYQLPMGGGAPPGEGDVILANYFLKFWNEREEARREALDNEITFVTGDGPPDPRYVTIAPTWPNLWAGLSGLTGKAKPAMNDLRTELRAMSLPVRRDDAFITVRGLPSTNPASLLDRRDIQDLVLNQLGGERARVVRPRGSAGQSRPWEAEGRLDVAANRPAYLQIDDGLLSGPGRLLVELSPPLRQEPGLTLTAWALADGEDGLTRRFDLEGDGPASPLTADFGGFGGSCRQIRVGVRFAAQPGLERVIEPGLEAAGRVEYRVTWIPEAEATNTGNGGDVPADTEGGGATGDGDGPGGAVNPGGAGAGTPAGEPPVQGPPAPESESPAPKPPAQEPSPPAPTIRVIRRSKQTTHRDPRSTVHQKWQWDFGDGTNSEDPDPSHTTATQSHAYAPGQYTVAARSLDQNGAVIRQLTWTFTVPEEEAGQPRAFTVETIREPRVKIVIDGPKMWVTGKPAEFRVTTEVDDPPYSEDKVVSIDPGPVFHVIWARPGTFDVSAAVTVRLSYRFPERSVFVVDTYLEKVEVQVCTTSGTE